MFKESDGTTSKLLNFKKPEASYLLSALGDSQTYWPIQSVGIATGILLSSLHLAGLATLTHTLKPIAFLNQCLDRDRACK